MKKFFKKIEKKEFGRFISKPEFGGYGEGFKIWETSIRTGQRCGTID
jgi:hypothetical protein